MYRASTIKGVPEDKKWEAANGLAMVGLPLDPTPNIDAEDGARVPNADATEAEVIPQGSRGSGGCGEKDVHPKGLHYKVRRDAGVFGMSVHRIRKTHTITHCSMQRQDRELPPRNR